MKSVITAVCLLFLSACSSSHQLTASPVGLVALDNYFVKNNVSLPGEYNYKTAVSQQEFDALFGMAKTADNTIKKPDFSGQTVVAVIGQPSTLQRLITIDGATLGGRDLNVYYRTKILDRRDHISTAAALATVPKARSVKQVNFYQDSVLVKTIPVTIY